MKHKRVKFAVAAAVAAILLIIGATLAFFTDNANTSLTGTAGTVDINISQPTLANAENYNPGDGKLISADITNLGNKSVDVRQTFKITMTPTAPATSFTDVPNDMGWAIYNADDCTLTNGNYVPNAGAAPIGTPTITDGTNGTKVVTYTVPTDAVLNGTGANAETENGITTNILSGEYVLVMLPDTDNSYQAAAVQLDILAEAKQHRNTASVSWTQLQTVSTTFGGAPTNIVPAKEQDASGSTID